MAPGTPILVLMVATLVVAITAGACSDSDGADSGPVTVTPGLSSPAGIPLAQPPGTTASAAGRTVEMGIGTYCWTSMCVDKIGPVTRGTLQVSRGATVNVAIPQGAPPLTEVHASVFPAGAPVSSSGGEEVWSHPPTDGTTLSTARGATGVEVQVDVAPGKYVLTVGMFFQPGDVAYGVVLEVR